MPNAPDILRVLIADDSAICRQALRHSLETDSEIRVVAEAQDGLEAVALTLQHRPHLVTMDLRMPKLNGLEAIEQIMRQRPTPILVVTDQPSLGGVDATFAALSRGALELLPKATAWHATGEVKALVAKVKQLARAAGEATSQPAPAAIEVKAAPKVRGDVGVIGMGASTGGPRALRDILSSLPATFGLPIVIVQHMNEQFHDGFVDWLARQSRLSVKPAVDGAQLQKGTAFIAPQGVHLVVEAGGVLRLRSAPAIGSAHVPSVDRLFLSLAESFGSASAGILLTGMGQDGAKGLKAIADRGGMTVAQDRRTSVIHGMPGAAIALGAAQAVLAPPQIAAFMTDCASATGVRGAAGPSSQRRKVLLVDDSAVVLEATRHALEDAGYEVVTSDNPIALPALVRKERPDLALVDVKMPAVAGDAVARIIGQGQGATQVILYSDLAKNELAVLAKDCGAKGYLKKSTEEQLIAYVNDFFARAGKRP